MHKLPRANAINSLPISLIFHKKTFKTPVPPTLNSRKTTKIPPKEKQTNLSQSAHMPSPQYKPPISLKAKSSQVKPSQANASKETPPLKMLKLLLPS